MPQTSPLSWLTMFMMFSTLTLMIMMILYSLNLHLKASSMIKPKKMMFKTKW